MTEIVSAALTIAQTIVTWCNNNIEAKERCGFLVSSISILDSSLSSIKTAKSTGKLDLDVKASSSLDAAVQQTFECLRDINAIAKIFDKKKKKAMSFLWNPAGMLDDIAKKRSDLQYCVQMVSICMQTSTFLKQHAPAAPAVNKAIGVSPAHTTEQKDIFATALADSEARAFWMSNFDSATTVVPWTIFYSKLCTAFNKGAPYDANTSQAIKLNVDPESKAQVFFYPYQKWVNTNNTIRAALKEAAQDVIQAPVVVVPIKRGVPAVETKIPSAATPTASPTSVSSTSSSSPSSSSPSTPSSSPPPPAAAVTSPSSGAIRGAADPENPPSELELIWNDPNIDKEWNKGFVDALAAGGHKWLPFESATDVVQWFTAHPEFLRSPRLRVMSNNRIYSFEADYSTQSAALDIVTHLRKKRAMIPVLIYCGGTLPHAQTIAASLRKTKATDDEEVALKFAKGEPIDF